MMRAISASVAASAPALTHNALRVGPPPSSARSNPSSAMRRKLRSADGRGKGGCATLGAVCRPEPLGLPQLTI